MEWLLSKLPWPASSKKQEVEEFSRRETELRRRFDRLSQEVEVMQRMESDQQSYHAWD